MADQQAEASAQSNLTSEEEPLLSNLDIFLFSLIVGLIIYWFVFRKKPETIPDFRPLEPMWVLIVDRRPVGRFPLYSIHHYSLSLQPHTSVLFSIPPKRRPQNDLLSPASMSDFPVMCFSGTHQDNISR